VKALNSEITTGMSAPPMGSVMIAEHQRQHEEGAHQHRVDLRRDHDGGAEAHGHQRQHHVDRVLRRQPEGLLHDALELGPGHHRTREGHRADQRTQRGQQGDHGAVHLAAGELDRRDRRRAAAHAVVDGDHLRHVGHRDLLAGDPGEHAAEADGDDHQQHVAHAGGEEGDHRGEHHADTGPDDALARRDRRAHALQAENEQNRGDEVARVNQPLDSHQFFSFDLNMASMRSVTT
jgi:hypothetical protein